MNYDIKKIPSSETIELANNLSEENNKAYFIFLSDDLLKIDRNYKDRIDKAQKRNTIISNMFGDDSFIVSSEFVSPSLHSYYDTTTRIIGRYERYKVVTDHLKSLSFVSSPNNLGPEYEQIFTIRIDNFVIQVLLQPNMFLSLRFNGIETPIITQRFFFEKEMISFLIKKHTPFQYISIVRDILIGEIIE